MMAETTWSFPEREYQSRMGRVREAMGERGLDGLLVAGPENVYYLCGLSHMGYFAYQALVVPLEGEPILVTRAMERATVRDQVPHVVHRVYPDEAPSSPEPLPEPRRLAAAGRTRLPDAMPATAGNSVLAAAGTAPLPARQPWSQASGSAAQAQATVGALREAGLADASRLGLEMSTSFMPHRIALQLLDLLPRPSWTDASGLVESVRMIQSPRELECTRRAAELSDSMMLSAIAAAGPGVETSDVMANLYQTMFRRGGSYPAFVPLVRSTGTLTHEHCTWDQGHQELSVGDTLFLEMSGCVCRYHAPLGRLVFIGEAPSGAARMLEICERAIDAATDRLGPGTSADEVYRSWHACLEDAGFASYQRHHCGYSVGIGFPPSWSGSGVPVGLRGGSSLELAPGMVFHLMSWLLDSGQGSSFLSDTVVVTETGCERLTQVPRDLVIRR